MTKRTFILILAITMLTGYVFLPVTFENGVPMIHWQAEWQLPQ